MVCESCGEKPKNTAKDFTKAVIEINNPEALVLLRKVVIPASMGDEESVPPAIGKYRNVLLQYEANDHIYLYSSDGIPTAITANIPQEILDSIAELEATDVILQQEIDDIKNSPDVVDIVDTYADLQAYDTSHLGDKDIIRVLTDETHDGASSYYRWDKQTETWTYIGSIQTAANTIFYADLSETGNTRHIYKNSDMTGTVSVQELLDANEDGQVILRMSSAQTPENFNDAYLQNTYVGVDDYQFLFLDNRNYYEYDGTATTDTSYYYSRSTVQLELTAGNNITITGNTISATDTTYSNFTGATTQQAGTSGLVPAPTTSDPDKYLKGDGSWGTPAGTTYTAGTNVQISSGNVISATDTTYSNFVGTDGQTAGTAGLVPAPATTDAGKFLKADGTWDVAGGGGDTVYSDKTTSNSSTGGAVYIGNLDTNQDEVTDPTTTDNHYKYFWALPGYSSQVQTPNDHTVNIMGIQSGTGGDGNMTIGWNAECATSCQYNTVIGYQARTASNNNNVVLGATANNSGESNVIIGYSAQNNGYTSNTVTIGKQATTGADYGVAIGSGTAVYQSNSIALGKGAYPTRVGELNIACDNTTAFNNTIYRVIGGVHDGVNAHDAATVGQLTAYSVLSGAGAPTTSTAAQYVGQFYYDTTNDGYYYCTAITAQGTNPETYSYTWTALSTGGGSGPTVVQTTGTSTTDVMSQNATTSMVFADPATKNIVQIGNGSSAVGNYSISIGAGASVNVVENGIYIGRTSNPQSYGVFGSFSIGAGYNSLCESSYTISLGTSSASRAIYETSLGAYAKSANNQCVGSVNLGAYSKCTRAGEVNVGSGTAGLGYNSTDYRVIGGVHDPVDNHDAATKGYVDGRVIQNAGAPTTSTAGTVGQILEDTTNGKLYICTAIDTTDPQNPSYTWTEVGAGGGGTTEIEYVNCTLTGATATGFTLSADKTATQVKALVESGKEVIYKFVNSTSVGSVLAGTYEFSVLFAGTNTSVDVVTGYGMTSTYGSQTQDVYTFIHTSSAVDVTAGTIPTVNDATLTIQKNGTTVQTFTANASSNATANIEVPTITMTTTDPGEGSALAADNFVAVYGGDPIIMDYSTSEINTGATWIDGSAIYKKTVNFGALPNATSKRVSHGISNLNLVIKVEGFSKDSNNIQRPAPYTHLGSSVGGSVLDIESSDIVIYTDSDRSGSSAYITLYYTKSA